MSRALFDHTVVTPTGHAARRGTVAMSLALHTIGLAVLVGWQFTSAFVDPAITQPLTLFVSRELTVPPEPSVSRPAVATTAVDAHAAPTVAPSNISAEVPTTPVATDARPPVLGGAVCTTCGTGVPGGIGETSVLAPPPPPTPAAVPVIFRVGGNIKPPERIAYLAPTYPPVAMTARIEGTVILEATIDEQGRVRDLKVLRSVPLLDQAAIDAVSRWRYTATRLNGVAVPVVMSVTVRFSLR